MTNKEFDTLIEKQMKIAEIKCKFAQFLKENNLDICCKNESDFLEIYFDFYEDGDPVLLYSSKIKHEESNSITYEDLIK